MAARWPTSLSLSVITDFIIMYNIKNDDIIPVNTYIIHNSYLVNNNLL